MPADAPEFAVLVERFRKLRAADRKAVWEILSPEEREALENACAELDQVGEQRDSAPDRQFRGYSPWLAALIEQSLAEASALSEMTPASRSAVAAAHSSTIEDGAPEPPLARLLRVLGITLAKPKAETETAC